MASKRPSREKSWTLDQTRGRGPLWLLTPPTLMGMGLPLDQPESPSGH